MQDGIVIKSSKAGMTVILNPDLPFPDLLASIAKKLETVPVSGEMPR